MKRKTAKWTIIIAILLSGATALFMIIVEPQIKRTTQEGEGTHSVKVIMADLRYERRIKLIREELDTLEEGRFTALFLSMYPIRSYDMYDLSYWRGLETFKAEMVMENGRELAGTLEYLQELDIMPDTVLFGLDPECLEEEYPLEDSLLKLIRQTPETGYEILFVNPVMAYWVGKEDAQWQAVIDRYEKAAKLLGQEENVKLFFACDREWLVCNDGNYAEDKMPTEAVAKTLLAYYTREEYLLTEENRKQRMDAARELIADWRSNDRTMAGLGDRTLVFMGDSTFGNFSDSTAVTGVVENFADAEVINCGYGGMAAAYGDPECPAMGDLLKAIERGDGSGIAGTGDGPPAVAAAAQIRQLADSGEETVIFLDFGINDYIKGFPVDGENPYYCSAYAGAMRSGIEKLQTIFPKGQLVLVTPNFIKYSNFGTNPVGEEASVFTDYVDALRELAKEYALPVLDIYTELGIDRDNYTDYLQDEIHLNETGRFNMGMGVLGLLQELSF